MPPEEYFLKSSSNHVIGIVSSIYSVHTPWSCPQRRLSCSSRVRHRNLHCNKLLGRFWCSLSWDYILGQTLAENFLGFMLLPFSSSAPLLHKRLPAAHSETIKSRLDISYHIHPCFNRQPFYFLTTDGEMAVSFPQIWLLSGWIYCSDQTRHVVGYFCYWFTWFIVFETTTTVFMILASSFNPSDHSVIWGHRIMISNVPSGSYIPWFHETKYYLWGHKFFHVDPKLAMWHR